MRFEGGSHLRPVSLNSRLESNEEEKVGMSRGTFVKKRGFARPPSIRSETLTPKQVQGYLTQRKSIPLELYCRPMPRTLW